MTMKLEIIKWNDLTEDEKIISIQRPTLNSLKGQDSTITQIFKDVRADGDEALKKFTSIYDGVNIDDFLMSEKEINSAFSRVPRDLIQSIENAIENVKKGVFSGDTLTKLFLKEPLFPPTFSQLISVGEQTGQLDEMFNSVAAYYEEEFDTTVDNMSSLIEPIMIVFMGVMIGGLMIAMYSPIFNVGAIIGS